MKTCNRSVTLIAALFLLALLAGCGSTTSSNTVPTVEQAFYAHSVVFGNNSTLLTAGYNEFGQLGNATLTSPFALVGSPINLGRVQGYAAGANHTLAFGNHSTIWAWGSNLHGRLGITGTYKTATSGTDAFVKYPVPFSLHKTVFSLATGWNHSLAVAGPDRSVMSWGANNFGQVGYGRVGNVLIVSGDDRPVPGAVVFKDLTPLDRVVQVAAGGSHSLALRDDGTVYSWGDNQFGQLGYATVTAAAPTLMFGMEPQQVTFTGTTAKVVQIAAAGSFSAALMDDGTVWEWGYNIYGQCGTKPEVTTNDNVITSTQYLFKPRQVTYEDGTPFLASKISLGTMHTIALSTTGEVWAWGWNEKAQLGLSTPVNNSATLMEFHPRKVSALGLIGLDAAPVTDIYAFGTVSFARVNARWYGWGDNGFGQLGQPIPPKTLPLIFKPVEFKLLSGA